MITNAGLTGGGAVSEYPVYPPEQIKEVAYDAIIIASLTGYKPITEQLIGMGVAQGKIITDFVTVPVKSRIIFLERLGELFMEKNIQGAVAEGGVFQGEFAREINRVFSNKKLYLFDTFEGFDEKDLATENKNDYSSFGAKHLDMTSVELVLKKLPYPAMCDIRKGYFPETTQGVADQFCFVNLDFDLYDPILAGLEFFYPRMVSGGIILVHDFFNPDFRGVKAAISEFGNRRGDLRTFPIGDGISIAIYCS
jgi:hypothetical protein